MRKGLLRTILSMIFIVALLAVGINFDIFAAETDIVLEEDSITLYAGTNATEEDQYYQFTLKGKGLAISPCVWRLSDDTYLTVDDKGLVRLKDNIPNNIDIPSIILTVCNETTNESDTALIFIETDPPLGGVIMTKNMFKDIYVESTLNPVVVTFNEKPVMTKDMFKDIYVESTLNPVVVSFNAKTVMTRDMFKDQYVESTLNRLKINMLNPH